MALFSRAAHLGRGGGHHAQFRFVHAALHREGDAADGEGAGEHAQVKDEAAREAQLRGDADDVDRNQARKFGEKFLVRSKES